MRIPAAPSYCGSNQASGERTFRRAYLRNAGSRSAKLSRSVASRSRSSARPEQWLDVGPTVLGIIVPDLPVVVWCRQKSALRSSANDRSQAGLESVLSLATKIIVDTRGIPVPKALARMREWKQRGRIVGDLEWTRLTAWRQTIAHVFEAADALSELKDIRTVEIAYTDETAPASALYAAAWLESGIAAKAVLKREEGFGAGLHRISLKSETTSIEL